VCRGAAAALAHCQRQAPWRHRDVCAENVTVLTTPQEMINSTIHTTGPPRSSAEKATPEGEGKTSCG